MVTTIKITCDGVFIQSETYNVTNTPVAKFDTAKKDLSSNQLTNNKNITPTSSRATLGCSIKSECRNRYYFGSRNTYFCKESDRDCYSGEYKLKIPKEVRDSPSKLLIDKHEFVHYCEKFREPSEFICTKSIMLEKNGFKRKNTISDMTRQSSVKSCILPNEKTHPSLSSINNYAKFQPETRFKSFFRSARNFHRSSSERTIATSSVETKSNDRASTIFKLRTNIFDTIIHNLPKNNQKSTKLHDDWIDEDASLTITSLQTGEDDRAVILSQRKANDINSHNNQQQLVEKRLIVRKENHKKPEEIETSKKPSKEVEKEEIVVLKEKLQVTQIKKLDKTINITNKRENQVMNTHATATQGGQTSIVGHHRGFSQSSVTVATNSASSGDPWLLQTSGHQMPPTAPLRHNKRPAPQPLNSVSNAAGAALAGIGAIGVGGSGSTALINTTGTAIGNVVASTLQLQQQLSQSQPHIVASSLLSTQHHHNNMNPHHNVNASLHLSSHALNSHNLINTNNHGTSNQQQQQQQHLMTTFVPQAAVAAALNNPNILPVVATTQQHPQLLAPATATTSTTSNNNNLMTSSLTLHERNLPPKSINMVSGMHGGSQMLLTSSSNMQMHHQLTQPPSQQATTVNSTTPIGGNMSTSLHSFDINGSSNATTAWVSSTNTSLSPTATGLVPPSIISNHQHPPQQQHQSHRKCEVKLNAMPWFHGSITRDEAEHLLQPRDDGLFLVRESTNFPGDYTLCVCFQGKVEHYRVKYLDNKLTIDDEEYFENLSQLVAHYEADADGLCTQLTKCLPKAGAQEFCINSKDFIDKGWVIPEADLQLRESIGKGEFGDVLLGILRNEKVAVKMLKDEGAVQKFLAEASVMTTLEHENLVKFVGLVFTSKHIYLVTEYMSKGSLVDYLRSRGRQHITKKDQINFAYDTASGMEYLEAKKVVHRDLAARNVLISEECVAKVSDFGLARGECYNLDVGKLPIKWTAPEALKNGRFSNKSDMWSFGILLWEIYSFGRVPYPRIPLNDVVKHVEVGYKMEAPEGCPAEIYEMMRQAWDLNPAKRPSFAELKVKLLHLKITTS